MDLYSTILLKLEQMSSEPPCCHYVSDETAIDLCEECARIELGFEVSPDRYIEALLDWDHRSDGSSCCDRCGRLLAYTLTDYGLEEEIDHFQSVTFRHICPDTAYEVARIMCAADWRDPPIKSEALKIGFAAVVAGFPALPAPSVQRESGESSDA